MSDFSHASQAGPRCATTATSAATKVTPTSTRTHCRRSRCQTSRARNTNPAGESHGGTACDRMLLSSAASNCSSCSWCQALNQTGRQPRASSFSCTSPMIELLPVPHSPVTASVSGPVVLSFRRKLAMPSASGPKFRAS